jgi:hypothetical protein
VALDRAGAEVVTAAEGLASVISTLIAALSGSAGMAGDDPAGAALGHSYDGSASKLIEAMATTRNGLCGLGIGVRMSAHNYSLAEAMSNIGGSGNPLPAPPSPGPISAGPPPSSVGSSDGAPPGWGWVAPYLGMIWPSGDSAKLRAAAAAWITAGTQFALGEILGTGAPMGAIRAQQIPEGAVIDRAFTDAYSSTTSLVQQCQQIAAQLTSYAAKVDKVHAAILDLLARICDPLTGIKEVWDILTDEDEDEIKQIADDIRTVVDYAARQWDQFLHSTGVGHAIDLAGHYAKNMWGEAGEAVEGLWNISSFRMLIDPIGYGKGIAGMTLGAAPLVGLGPDGAPSVWDSWKTLGKDVSHWDQWKTDPAGAAGRTVFDVGTLFLPGGPLSKLGTKGRAALDALKGFKEPTVPKLPEPQVARPPETPKPPPAPEPAPGGKPPEPGSPAPPKPGPAATGTPPPHSPTEPKPPVAPPGRASKPPELPHPHERVPAQVPAPSGGDPGEPVPTAAAPSASTPAASVPSASAPSTPHPPSPPSVPMGGGAPAEAPLPHGGTPHAGEPGAHEPHRPHDGAPRPPGDGDWPPHQPADGNGHPSANGSPHEPDGGTPHQPGDGEPPPDDPADRHPHATPSDLKPWHRAQLALAESPEQLVNDLVKHRCPRELAESALHSPYEGMTPQGLLDRFWNHAEGTWDWPKANGFADGKWETVHSIPKSASLDRIGEVSDQRGDFMGTTGDSYPQRSLAPGSSGDYHVFHGTGRELPPGWEVRYGTVGEAFGQPGGGTQWVVVDDKNRIVLIQRLIDDGYLALG